MASEHADSDPPDATAERLRGEAAIFLAVGDHDPAVLATADLRAQASMSQRLISELRAAQVVSSRPSGSR